MPTRRTWLRQPTRREQQCLANALLHGRDQAALALGIAPSTMRNHLDRTYQRLGVNTSAEAALALGWLSLPEDLVVTIDGKGAAPIPDDAALQRAEALLSYAHALLEKVDAER